MNRRQDLAGLSIPCLVAKSVHDLVHGIKNRAEEDAFDHFKTTAKDLGRAFKHVVVGLALGVAFSTITLIHDTIKLIGKKLDSCKNLDGNAAILAVDVQYDFFSEGNVSLKGRVHTYDEGGLAVPDACKILPPIHRPLDRRNPRVSYFASQDWHPANHGSFAVNLGTASLNLPMDKSRGFRR